MGEAPGQIERKQSTLLSPPQWFSPWLFCSCVSASTSDMPRNCTVPTAVTCTQPAGSALCRLHMHGPSPTPGHPFLIEPFLASWPLPTYVALAKSAAACRSVPMLSVRLTCFSKLLLLPWTWPLPFPLFAMFPRYASHQQGSPLTCIHNRLVLQSKGCSFHKSWHET